MGKFYGVIGYAEQVKTKSGTWQEVITERLYYGDDVKISSRQRDGENLNPDITIDDRLSIVADPYAEQHFHLMRYVIRYGAKWKITSVDVKWPRLILTIGGVYNEQQVSVASYTGEPSSGYNNNPGS